MNALTLYGVIGDPLGFGEAYPPLVNFGYFSTKACIRLQIGEAQISLVVEFYVEHFSDLRLQTMLA